MRRCSSIAIVAAALLSVLGPGPSNAQQAPASARMVGTVLNAAAIDKELAFYKAAFGLEVGMTLDHGTRREYMLRFSKDPMEAGLILVHDSAPASPSQLTHGNAFDRIVLRVSDMDALVARLDARGFPHEAVRRVAQGYSVLQLQDPEGYPIEVIQSAAKEHAQ